MKTPKSKASDDRRTPRFLFDHYHEQYNYVIDVAASKSSTLVPLYYDEKIDALECDWLDDAMDYRENTEQRPAVWCNPPFSDKLQTLFLEKAVEEARRGLWVTCLIPSTTETLRWVKHVSKAASIEFLYPRLNYFKPDGTIDPNVKWGSSIVHFYNQWSSPICSWTNLSSIKGYDKYVRKLRASKKQR